MDWRGRLQQLTGRLAAVPEEKKQMEASVAIHDHRLYEDLPVLRPLVDREILPAMLSLIDRAALIIRILAFTFDHTVIYHALVRAMQRGVKISIVLDESQMLRKGSCVHQKELIRNFMEWNNELLSFYTYKPKHRGRNAVQHIKAMTEVMKQTMKQTLEQQEQCILVLRFFKN